MRNDIAEGRRRLALDRSRDELYRDTSGLFAHGSKHFGNASKLIGLQCGGPLTIEELGFTLGG